MPLKSLLLPLVSSWNSLQKAVMGPSAMTVSEVFLGGFTAKKYLRIWLRVVLLLLGKPCNRACLFVEPVLKSAFEHSSR